MKKLCITLGISLLTILSVTGQQLYTLDFESVTNGVDYTTSINECINGDKNVYFGVFTEDSLYDNTTTLANGEGAFFSARQLNDSPCSSGSAGAVISITGIDISNVTGFLEFSIDVARRSLSGNDDWLGSTLLHLDYQVDGNGYQEGIWFESEPRSPGSTKGFGALDSDFDGVGDGARINSSLTAFTRSVLARGDSLDLRITLGGFREPNANIVFDNIQVSETQELPDPQPKNLPYVLDFDSQISEVDYFTSIDECNDGNTFFGVLEDPFSLESNNNYFAIGDITGSPCNSSSGTETISIEGINISEITDFLKLSIDLAEVFFDTAGLSDDSFFQLDYQVDNGGFNEGLRISPTGGLFGAVDRDFDGLGEGERTSTQFLTFNRLLNVSGDSLDLRITLGGTDLSGKFLAFDNVSVEEVSEAEKTVPFVLDFENSPNGFEYSTSLEECNESGNFFGNVTNASLPANLTNGRYFGANNITQSPCGSSDGIETIFINDIDISSAVDNLKLLVDLGRISSIDWDEDEFVHIDYQIDGGGFQNGIWLESDAARIEARDLNFDGQADSDSIPQGMFEEFYLVLEESGNTLDLRITIALDGTDHDIILDNIKVEETAEQPAVFVESVDPVSKILPYVMNFENVVNGVDYTTSLNECFDSDGTTTNFFGVFDEDSLNVFLTNDTGLFFGARAMRNAPCNTPNNSADTLSITGIDITNNPEFELSADIARVESGAQWLNGSRMQIDYQIDGGGYQNGIHIRTEITNPPVKGVPAFDSDFDGVGDSTRIDRTFREFTKKISATGDSLDLRITFGGFLNNVDILLDNISIIAFDEVIFTGDEGWRLLSIPISDNTYNELLEPIWTQGIASGADFTDGEPNVLTFNNGSDEFEAISDLNETITPGTGFAVYMFSDDDFDGTPDGFPKTLSHAGIKNTGSVSTDLNKGITDDDAFTLVGNPFDQTIDWDLLTRNDLTETVYVYDPSIPGYVTWNGITGGLQDGLINPYTGFFVENSSSSNPLLTLEETDIVPAKVVNENLAFSLIAAMNNLESAAYFSFTEQGLTEKDNFDARKFAPLDFKAYTSLSSKIGEDLFDINNLPADFEEEIVIPIVFASYEVGEDEWIEQSGEVTFSWTDIQNLPEDWNIILRDAETGAEINLKEEEIYTFDVEGTRTKVRPATSLLASLQTKQEKATSADDRFTLTVSKGELVSNEPEQDLPGSVELQQNYPNPFNPSTTIGYAVPQTGDVTLEVFNLLGQKVATLLYSERKSAGRHTVNFDASSLSSGMYIYRLQAGNSVITKKLTLIK